MVMGVAVKVFLNGVALAGQPVDLYRMLGGPYEVENYQLIATATTEINGVANFGPISPDGPYIAGVKYAGSYRYKQVNVLMGSALSSFSITTDQPIPSRTVAARVPMFGNSAYVQKYLRRLRDRFLGKWHRRLHPII